MDAFPSVALPLSDALGSTRLTVDDTGTPIGTQEWDAWGNQRSSTGTNYGFGWTGQQYDTSSDLTYLRARYYSPGAARCSGAWSVAC